MHVTTSTGDKLVLYVKANNGLRQIWSSTLQDKFDRWFHEDVDLTPIDTDRFTVVFHVRFGSWCRNSVGLDDIKFHSCPVGK